MWNDWVYYTTQYVNMCLELIWREKTNRLCFLFHVLLDGEFGFSVSYLRKWMHYREEFRQLLVQLTFCTLSFF